MPYKRGTTWVAQVRRNCKRREKLFSSKKEALQWEAEQKRSPDQNWQKKTDMVCLLDWANEYLEFAESRFVKKTFQEKKTVFARFFNAVEPGLPIFNIKPGKTLKYLQEQNKLRSGNAANRDRKNLVAAWNWGIKYSGLPAPNPFLVEKFSEERRHRYIPPEEDFWKVHDKAEGQDRLMLLGFLHLAARRGEIFRLRWDDIDFAQSRIRLSTRKRMGGTMESDWLPLTPDLYDALLAHKQVTKSEWVFSDPDNNGPYLKRQNWIKRQCKRAGVKYFCYHAIRHLTASILARENVPMIEIQAILRHKNLSTTELYIKRMSGLERALRVLSGGKSRQHEPSEVLRNNSQVVVNEVNN
jgi:integrase